MNGASLEKDSIVKTLLTSSSLFNLTFKMASTQSKKNLPPNLHNLVRTSHSLSQKDKMERFGIQEHFNDSSIENSNRIIMLEHCYARPPDHASRSSFCKETRLLFFQPPTLDKEHSDLALLPAVRNTRSHEIDVETVLPLPPEIYDKAKALQIMNECEKHAMLGRVSRDDGDDWEASISKTNWTPVQIRLFSGMVNILNADRLARLASTDTDHEPIHRRVCIDKSVKRVRQLFATISWDFRLTQWLHLLLIDHLSTSYLAAYLDILQTLKAKVSTFVDKMMYGPNSSSRVGITSNENLFHLLKRTWDPCAGLQGKNKKLHGSCVIIVIPSTLGISNINIYKRQHRWINLLSTISNVVTVHASLGNTVNRLTMVNYADQVLVATRAKIQEVKNDYPGKPIVLVGFHFGSSVALQVAQVEHVLCVVSLGFSLLTAEGRRGEPDDLLLELQCPALFVIGQCSNTSFHEDLEDLKERMRFVTGLIIIGSADDYLRVSSKTKRAEGITQSAVDRIIMDHVGEYIYSLILLPPQLDQIRQSPTHASSGVIIPRRTKIERKRNNSNTSSIDSEPPSPTPKITRPVGRPPGSKSKVKLENKWTAQMVQGISPSPSPPPLTSLTSSNNDTTTPLLHSLQSPPDTTSQKSIPFVDSVKDNNDKPSIDNPTKLNSATTKLSTNSALNMQVLGINRPVLNSANTVSTFLQTGCRPPKQSGIKVLENLKLNANSTTKLISSTTGRSIDLSKITVLNSTNSTKGATPVGNVVLMSDGTLKPIGHTMKGTGSTPLVLPMSSRNKLANMHSLSNSSGHRNAKYITSKKQLIGRKPPLPVQKSSVVIPYTADLPPPKNLTSQDIMDLPIIFADDNQMLTDNSKLQDSDILVPETVETTHRPKLISNPVGKFVFINKQVPQQSTSVLNTNSAVTVKRPTLTLPVRTNMNSMKYTKIIISRATPSEHKPADVTTVPCSSNNNSITTSSGSTSNTIFNKIKNIVDTSAATTIPNAINTTTSIKTVLPLGNLSSEISIKKVSPTLSTIDTGDVEKEITANVVTKSRYEEKHNLDAELHLAKSVISSEKQKRKLSKTEFDREQEHQPKIIKLGTSS